MTALEARVALLAYLGEACWDENVRLPQLRFRLNSYRDAIIVETQRKDAQRIREFDGEMIDDCSVCAEEARRIVADLIDPDKEN